MRVGKARAVRQERVPRKSVLVWPAAGNVDIEMPYIIAETTA
jgi:hypothetical protein